MMVTEICIIIVPIQNYMLMMKILQKMSIFCGVLQKPTKMMIWFFGESVIQSLVSPRKKVIIQCLKVITQKKISLFVALLIWVNVSVLKQSSNQAPTIMNFLTFQIKVLQKNLLKSKKHLVSFSRFLANVLFIKVCFQKKCHFSEIQVRT